MGGGNISYNNCIKKREIKLTLLLLLFNNNSVNVIKQFIFNEEKIARSKFLTQKKMNILV